LDLKQIKLVIDLMRRSDLTEFAVEEEGFKLKICRNGGAPNVSSSRGSLAPFPVNGETQAPVPVHTAPAPAPLVPVASSSEDEAGITYVKSPMVGTFYRSASPESKPFAEIGAKISENTAVCIIEAMKIMNEIQAEVKGTILEVLVESGQPVEYGQKLFKLKQG
jgi:acetyl-CoA carboxylase biotin carboxyl carrier protein